MRSLLSIKISSMILWMMSPMQQKIFTLRLFWLFVPIRLSVSPISSEVAQIYFQVALVSSLLSVRPLQVLLSSSVLFFSKGVESSEKEDGRKDNKQQG